MKLISFKASSLWGYIFFCLLSFFHAGLYPQTPDSIQNQYISVLKLMGEEEYDQAIQGFQQLIAENPDFGKAYGKLAEVYLLNDDREGGQRHFEKLIDENSENAYAYYGLAQIDLEKEEYDQAIENLKKCIKLDSTFAEAYHSTRGGLPAIYAAQNQLDTSIQFFNELIQADSRNSFAYYGLAGTYQRKNYFDQALTLVDKAIEFNPELLPAYSLKNYCLYFTSRYQEVIENCEIMLKLIDRSHDEYTVLALIYLGYAYSDQKDNWKGLQFISKSLKIAREIYNPYLEGVAISDLATIYAVSGNFSKALAYSQASLEIVRKTGDKFSETGVLENIGHLNRDLGNVQESLKYYEEALLLARKNGFKNRENTILMEMAHAFRELYQYDKALEYQYEALEITKEIGQKQTEGWALWHLGKLHRELEKYETASNYLQQSLKIGTALQDILLISAALTDLGSTFKHQKNKKQAIDHYARAIALHDSIKADLRIESLTSTFLENRYAAYPAIVQLLAESGKFSEAFTYTEKYKAQTLLDILAEGQTQLESLPDTLRGQLDDLQLRLEDAHAELSLLSSQDEQDKNQLVSLEQQITDLELQKAALLEQIKKVFGAFYQLTVSQPLSVEEVQSRVLQEGQALIEYLVGDERLSVFVITADSIHHKHIDISNDRLKQMLGDLSPVFRQGKTPDEESRQQIFSPQLADFSIPPAYALYNALIKPLEPSLSGIEDLIIVPDDILFYPPFEMLVYDTSGIETRYDFANAKFLLEKYAVSYASSASLLDPGLRRPREARDDILAFGNPDFDAPAEEAEATELLASNLRYGGGVVRGSSLVSLPYSETEVKTIGKEFKSTVFTGNAATEENFKAEAKDHRILHFATHFLTDDNHPLYSKIVLAQNNRGKEDGYLQTYEIFNLNLNADLAVLSACNTGLGKLQRGEGLVGVSRAFLYAGIPSLVVSLWSIDDESTSMIIENFYRHLSDGLNKKQALRLAKLDYLKSVQNIGKDPFYWAPYILIGDWSAVQLSARASLNPWIWFFAAAVLILIAVFFIRKRRRSSQQ